MTKHILILEGDHKSIKKNIIFTREILKKGFVQNKIQLKLQWKTLKAVSNIILNVLLN